MNSFYATILGLLGGLLVVSNAAPVKEAASVADKVWMLIRLTEGGEEVRLVGGRAPVTFSMTSKGKVTGQSAVNRYFGSLAIDGDGACQWGGAFGATRMAGPPEAMALETQFLSALSRTSTVELTDGVLTFASTDGETAVGFVSSVLEGSVVVKKQAGAKIAAGTTIVVSLLDTSLADAPSQTISKVEIIQATSFPVKFRLPYASEQIKPGRSYTLAARIESEGKLRYITDTAHPVFEEGKPPTDAVVVEVIEVIR